MALYDYQKRAVDSTWAYIRQNQGNPCIVIPTGGGKTHVMAQMIADCLRWQKRVIVAAHTFELMRQLHCNLESYGVDSSKVGFYSNTVGERETEKPVILATIQSIFSKADEFGVRDVIFVDECHRVNPQDEDTQYRRFFACYPNSKIIGLTATPYRLGSGLICDQGSLFNAISCEVSIRELLFSDPPKLCTLRSKWVDGIDTSKLSISGGEFAKDDEQKAFDEILESVCVDMYQRCKDRKSIIVFCSGVQHCKDVSNFLHSRYTEAAFVIEGNTPDDERKMRYDAFRGGNLRWLINYGVLTEGFDAKNIDAVVLQRATTSPGLYYQMAGRGLRLHPSKSDCLVLDYGENIARHGPIDKIEPGKRRKQGQKKEAPVKACPQCKEAVVIQARQCDVCGYEWEVESTPKIKGKASNEDIISDGEPVIGKNGFLKDFFYSLADMKVSLHKRKKDGKEIVKIEYFIWTESSSSIGLMPFYEDYKDFENPNTFGLMDSWWKYKKTGVQRPVFNEYAWEVLTRLAEDESRRPTGVKWILKKRDNPDFPTIVYSYANKYRNLTHADNGQSIDPAGYSVESSEAQVQQ